MLNKNKKQKMRKAQREVHLILTDFLMRSFTYKYYTHTYTSHTFKSNT